VSIIQSVDEHFSAASFLSRAGLSSFFLFLYPLRWSLTFPHFLPGMSEDSQANQAPRSPPPAIVAEERRPQAEPLPSKRGEIGFIEGVHAQVANLELSTEAAGLPERHPADRDSAPPAEEPAPSESGHPLPPLPLTSSEQNAPSSPTSISKSSSILGFLRPNKSIGGVQLITLIIFCIQLLVLGGTVVAWVFLTKIFEHLFSNAGNGANLSSTIFIHVVFVIAVILQLVFLERRLFRLRAERYSHLHPGEILPRHRTIPLASDTSIAFAPWNRPPLPTYAAALAQSGVGTGDVEDHLIAAPPPPAYGNTRGSTLLLQGYLRDSLRAQRPPSVHSARSLVPDGRPMSYVSSDEEWEEIQDAERARRLEETLDRLEAPQTSRN